MNSSRHDEIPVLPEEATDLAIHVRQCSLRYNALLRYHYEISKRLRWADWTSWLYRAITLPAVLWIAWQLGKMQGLMP